MSLANKGSLVPIARLFLKSRKSSHLNAPHCAAKNAITTPAIMVSGLTIFSIPLALNGLMTPSIIDKSVCGKLALFAMDIFTRTKNKKAMPKDRAVPILVESVLIKTEVYPVSVKKSQSEYKFKRENKSGSIKKIKPNKIKLLALPLVIVSSVSYYFLHLDYMILY